MTVSAKSAKVARLLRHCCAIPQKLHGRYRIRICDLCRVNKQDEPENQRFARVFVRFASLNLAIFRQIQLATVALEGGKNG